MFRMSKMQLPVTPSSVSLQLSGQQQRGLWQWWDQRSQHLQSLQPLVTPLLAPRSVQPSTPSGRRSVFHAGVPGRQGRVAVHSPHHANSQPPRRHVTHRAHRRPGRRWPQVWLPEWQWPSREEPAGRWRRQPCKWVRTSGVAPNLSFLAAGESLQMPPCWFSLKRSVLSSSCLWINFQNLGLLSICISKSKWNALMSSICIQEWCRNFQTILFTLETLCLHFESVRLHLANLSKSLWLTILCWYLFYFLPPALKSLLSAHDLIKCGDCVLKLSDIPFSEANLRTDLMWTTQLVSSSASFWNEAQSRHLFLGVFGKLPYPDLEEKVKEISTFLQCGLVASSPQHLQWDLSSSSGAMSLPC